jgi:hypothetical protein
LKNQIPTKPFVKDKMSQPEESKSKTVKKPIQVKPLVKDKKSRPEESKSKNV